MSKFTRNFLHTLPEAVVRSSSKNNAISCVLPVLWKALFYRIMGEIQILFIIIIIIIINNELIIVTLNIKNVAGAF